MTQFPVVMQFKTRSFMKFILSKAEGFRMTTPIKCHSELAAILLKRPADPQK